MTSHCDDCEEAKNSEHGWMDIPANGNQEYRHENCKDCTRIADKMRKHYIRYGFYRE